MGKESGELVKCSACGDRFSSKELLKEHFRIEHSDLTYSGPANQSQQGELMQKFDSHVRPHLNTSFFLGSIFGFLATIMLAHGYATYDDFTGPEPVEVTVVTCDNCSYGSFQNATSRLFKTDYREVNYQSDEGQQLIDKYSLNYVPGFIFEKEVERRDNFSKIAVAVASFEDAYVVADKGNRVAQRLSQGKDLN
jgi:hypothetical protein